MTERAARGDASFSGEARTSERISREYIAIIVASWNRDSPNVDPTAERGVEIKLVSEREFEQLRQSIEAADFLTDETRAEMQQAARRDYELRRAQDDEYIEDVNRWLEQHPNQVGVVTRATAHAVMCVKNHDGWIAPCIFDENVVPRESIFRAQLSDDET